MNIDGAAEAGLGKPLVRSRALAHSDLLPPSNAAVSQDSDLKVWGESRQVLVVRSEANHRSSLGLSSESAKMGDDT